MPHLASDWRLPRGWLASVRRWCWVLETRRRPSKLQPISGRHIQVQLNDLFAHLRDVSSPPLQPQLQPQLTVACCSFRGRGGRGGWTAPGPQVIGQRSRICATVREAGEAIEHSCQQCRLPPPPPPPFSPREHGKHTHTHPHPHTHTHTLTHTQYQCVPALLIWRDHDCCQDWSQRPVSFPHVLVLPFTYPYVNVTLEIPGVTTDMFGASRWTNSMLALFGPGMTFAGALSQGQTSVAPGKQPKK